MRQIKYIFVHCTAGPITPLAGLAGVYVEVVA